MNAIARFYDDAEAWARHPALGKEEAELWSEIAALPRDIVVAILVEGLWQHPEVAASAEEIIHFIDPHRAQRVARIALELPAIKRRYKKLRISVRDAGNLSETIEIGEYTRAEFDRAKARVRKEAYEESYDGSMLPKCVALIRFWRAHPAKRRGLSKKTIALRQSIVEELAKLPDLVSTRQIYYRIISAGILPNATKSYRCIAELLVDMRDDGTIAYERIVDRGRAAVKRSAWSSSVELMKAATEQFYLERWAEQPTTVHIALEKRALEGVFNEACRAYGVPLYPFGGYASVPLLYAWSKEIKAATDRGQRVQIYYFGDFDADGLDIERAAIARLRERHGAVFDWERRGLLREDLDAPGMVILPSKGKSPRAKSYRNTFGRIGGAELDALDPGELLRRVEDAVEPHIDRDAWARIEREEKLQRADMAAVFNPKSWPIAVAAARGAA